MGGRMRDGMERDWNVAYILLQHQTVSPLREAYLVIFTPCGDFCGDFHDMSESPKVFVVILFKVVSMVREHYESTVSGANIFKSMCT